MSTTLTSESATTGAGWRTRYAPTGASASTATSAAADAGTPPAFRVDMPVCRDPVRLKYSGVLSALELRSGIKSRSEKPFRHMTRTDTTRRGAMALAGGAALAGLSGPASAQSEGPTTKPDFGDWLDDVDGGVRDARGQDSVTVRVGDSGNGGTFAFRPANLWIDPGTTVTFEWVSNTHNVAVEDQPDGASWSGHETVENQGFSFETTFETGGLYRYFCSPHRSAGMLGGIAVGDDVPTTQVQTGSTYSLPSAPGAPVLYTGFALVGAAAAVVLGAEGVSEIRRHGGVRGETPESTAATEANELEPAAEIEHDEYDPWGTLSLLLVYLAIISLMWLFMYFVEFLGNGPTVIG